MNIINPTTQSPEFDPQFHDPAKILETIAAALREDRYEERTRNRQQHSNDPEQYFLLWHERLERESDSAMRRLIEMYVAVHRRYRGVTVSDQTGYFGTRPETRGLWIDHDPNQDGEVHPINIVRPDIRANTAALLQVNVGIDVEPASADARNRQRAERIQAMVDFFERDTWTEGERALIFDGIQKEGTVQIETYLDRDAGREQIVPYSNQTQTQVMHLRCDGCDYSTEKVEFEAERDLGNTCPNCGGPADTITENLAGFGLGENKYKTVEIAHKVHAGFNFCIDRKGARTKGIQSAKYLQIMDLAERGELEDEYPQFTFDAPFEWSYQLKCQHALACADWTILYSGWVPALDSYEWDLFEKKTIFLHESAYRNYVSPSDWEFVDARGRVKLSISRGEKLSEAVQSMYGKDCKGLRLVFVNERLIDIETPPDFEPNFRKCFTDVHFNRDSGSYHSLPHWDSVQIQDDITMFNTLKTETAARNSIEPVWFNSEVFDIHDFGRDYIPSKDGALDQTTDIGTAVFKPPVARSADSINEHLLFLLGIRREVSGVQPALLGESQPEQPYAAQRQQLEQSFGLLAPASKSYAQMKVESTKQKILLAFKIWTIEQFQAVASRNGQTWDEADVAELVATDLNRDVIIDYVPGTEVPQGNLTRELKFWNGVREALPIIQTAIQTGTLNVDVFAQLLKRIDEFADFDFDLSGKEVTDALAQKRYEAIQAACESYSGFTRHDIEQMKQEAVSAEPVNDPATGEVVIGEDGNPAMNTITAFDVLGEEIFFQANIFISPLEDPQTQLAFFIPEIMNEIAKSKPNYLLIEMMQALCSDFSQTIATTQERAAANDPAAIAARSNAESQAAEKDANRETQEAEQSRKHEQDIEKMAITEASRENDREFQREQAARQMLMEQ